MDPSNMTTVPASVAPVWTPAPVSPGPVASSSMPLANQRRMRLWPVLLTLYFLSPFAGEVLSGSTPPLLFIQPFGFIFIPLLYGSSAILIREIAVRRRLGWGNVLLLGAGFGIFQEALVVQTWFNFMAKDSPSHSYGSYNAFLGTRWDWALYLTVYHAVISITVPLILLELFLPKRAALPGLGPKRTVLLLAWLLIPCGLLAVNVAFHQLAKEGYAGPPIAGYSIAVVLLILVLTLGSLIRFPAARPNLRRSTPKPWVVGLVTFALTVLFFAVAIVLPNGRVTPPITMLIGALILAFALWRIRSWSARQGWNERHHLAIAMGVLAYFLLLWGPLIEFALRVPSRTGLVLTNLIFFLALIVFDQRLKRRIAARSLSAAQTA